MAGMLRNQKIVFTQIDDDLIYRHMKYLFLRVLNGEQA